MKQSHKSTAKDNNIDQFVNDAMTSIDMVDPAHPRPYMYTRIKARISKDYRAADLPIFQWMWNGYGSLAMLAIIM